MAELSGLAFRRARRDEADAIAELHADSWRRRYRGAYSDAFLDGDVTTDRRAVWRRRLDDPAAGAATILATCGDELIGFVHVVLDDEPRWGSLVDNLHVWHGHQRSGVGTKLIAEAAGAVVSDAVGSGLYLWVLEQNAPAQAFYVALGGRCVERAVVGAPGGDSARLNGTPVKLRLVWDAAEALMRPR